MGPQRKLGKAIKSTVAGLRQLSSIAGAFYENKALTDPKVNPIAAEYLALSNAVYQSHKDRKTLDTDAMKGVINHVHAEKRALLRYLDDLGTHLVESNHNGPLTLEGEALQAKFQQVLQVGNEYLRALSRGDSEAIESSKYNLAHAKQELEQAVAPAPEAKQAQGGEPGIFRQLYEHIKADFGRKVKDKQPTNDKPSQNGPKTHI